eukprot:6193535-Pleurochrysis_carterae.AAC.2
MHTHLEKMHTGKYRQVGFTRKVDRFAHSQMPAGLPVKTPEMALNADLPVIVVDAGFADFKCLESVPARAATSLKLNRSTGKFGHSKSELPSEP